MQTLIGFGLGVLFIVGVVIGVHAGTHYVPREYIPHAIAVLTAIGLTSAIVAWRIR